MWHNEFVRRFGGEGNPNQGPFAETGFRTETDGGIPPQPSPPLRNASMDSPGLSSDGQLGAGIVSPNCHKKTDFEKLAQIWATLCACDKTFRVLGKEWTEYEGVPIRFWIEDAKECFTS